MPDNKYEKLFKEIFKNKLISDELEKSSPGIKGQMAGYLMRRWFPSDWKRRTIMVIIALVALIGGFIYNNPRLFYLLLILPLFSPRCIAYIAMLFGKPPKK